MNLRITKFCIMKFLAGTGKLDEFVSVANALVQAAAKVFFIWLCTTQHEKFVSIINQFAAMKYNHQAFKKVNKVRVNFYI